MGASLPLQMFMLRVTLSIGRMVGLALVPFLATLVIYVGVCVVILTPFDHQLNVRAE